MEIAMISTIMKTAPTMEEIAVDLMSTHNTAQNVNALKEEVKVRMQQHYLEDKKKKEV